MRRTLTVALAALTLTAAPAATAAAQDTFSQFGLCVAETGACFNMQAHVVPVFGESWMYTYASFDQPDVVMNPGTSYFFETFTTGEHGATGGAFAYPARQTTPTTVYESVEQFLFIRAGGELATVGVTYQTPDMAEPQTVMLVRDGWTPGVYTPEPATLALLAVPLAGLLGLGAVRRRQRSARS